MLLYQLGLLLLLLPVCSFAPGFFFIRKLRWNPLEKLCGSLGLSLILLYLAGWGYLLSGSARRQYARQPLAIRRGIAGLFRDGSRLLEGYFAPAASIAGEAGSRRVRIGRRLDSRADGHHPQFFRALWFGDWLEHFQRTLFFLQHFPEHTRIFPGYDLPARPPMMNVLAGFFLAQTADRFELFQVVFGYLNILLFLPCCLLMPALGKGAKRRVWLLTLLFVASPLVMQNTTYTWTKAAAAFYIVMALWFYLAGWRKNDSVRITAAFVSLAAGLLVHYSAGPYIVILTLHYLIRVWSRRRNKWQELAWIAAACGLLVGTWLLWTLAVYGVHTTFASNSTVTSSQQYSGSTVEKIAANIFSTIVPVVVREPALLDSFRAQSAVGALRDWFFLFYQVNAIFGMGLVGGPVALWLAYRALRRRRALPSVPASTKSKKPARKPLPAVTAVTPEQLFWRILIAAAVVLGIAVVGERDPLGVGHLTLLSLQVVGLTMIAALLPLKRGLLAIVILGCAVDFSFGVWLQAHVEGRENDRASVFPGMEFTGKTIQPISPGPDALSSSAWNNWFEKHRLSEYEVWLRDLQQKSGNLPAFQAMLPDYRKTMENAAAEDRAAWQGWFAHHGGDAEFIGDHVASGSAVLQGVLVALFLGLAGFVYRRAA